CPSGSSNNCSCSKARRTAATEWPIRLTWAASSSGSPSPSWCDWVASSAAIPSRRRAIPRTRERRRHWRCSGSRASDAAPRWCRRLVDLYRHDPIADRAQRELDAAEAMAAATVSPVTGNQAAEPQSEFGYREDPPLELEIEVEAPRRR